MSDSAAAVLTFAALAALAALAIYRAAVARSFSAGFAARRRPAEEAPDAS